MRIGLLRRQQPFAEFVNNSWRVWYIYNNDVTSGTYYDMQSDGVCDRVTIQDGEVMNIDRVTTPSVVDYEQLANVDQYIRGASL